jgi:hypothetical protein
VGCDIHDYAEVRLDGRWTARYSIFDTDRNYAWFGFLADVRNYSHSPVIAAPRGLPDDADLDAEEREDALWCDFHSHSWLTLAELLAYDYDQVIWDRRITKGGNGAALAEEGEGQHLPLREFLGETFFRRLQLLAELGKPEDVRLVFWFDN